MKKKLLTIVASVFLVTHFVGAQDPATWAEDVACIIYNKCSSCHNPEGVGPFNLLSYEDAFTNRLNIRWAVQSKYMPPWRAERGHVAYLDDMSLTDEEIETIVSWINNDAPEGDPELAPNPPDDFSPIVITDPDVVIEFDEYTSQADEEDDFRCFVKPWEETEQQFIVSSEVIPSNTNIVHHTLFGWDAEDTAIALDEQDPGPGYYCFGGFGSNTVQLIGAWVPGSNVNNLPEGFGFSVPAGGNMVMQTHYPEGSIGQSDATSVRFKLSDDPSIRQVQSIPLLNHFANLTNGPLFIEANTVKTFYAEQTIPVDLVLLAVAPHAHLIAKSMRSFAVTPSGDTLALVEMPQWDFDWQLTYVFKKPVVLPAGSTVYGEIVYDNTTANPRNPSDPPIDVSVGEETTDEMFLFFFAVSLYQEGDEDLEFADSDPKVDCVLSAVETLKAIESIRIAPNPSSAFVHILADSPFDAEVRLLDTGNRLVRSYDNLRLPARIDVEQIPSGVYFLHIRTGQNVSIKKIVINRAD